MRKVKIGLALGSGAARGWSHIGVINALQRLGIEIDIVAGCSIGSLVGAAYSCGKLPELETWVRSFSYWDVLRLMDLSWQRGGLLRGERVFNHYRQVMPLSDFADCQRPFGAVATNLSTRPGTLVHRRGYPPCRARLLQYAGLNGTGPAQWLLAGGWRCR